MTKIEIEYCVPCGHLNRAIDTQRALLEEFGQRLDGVELVTGDGGVFKLRVDDEEVFDKSKEGFDIGEITSRVEERITTTA